MNPRSNSHRINSTQAELESNHTSSAQCSRNSEVATNRGESLSPTHPRTDPTPTCQVTTGTPATPTKCVGETSTATLTVESNTRVEQNALHAESPKSFAGCPPFRCSQQLTAARPDPPKTATAHGQTTAAANTISARNAAKNL